MAPGVSTLEYNSYIPAPFRQMHMEENMKKWEMCKNKENTEENGKQIV
jgi:hypothetical protein